MTEKKLSPQTSSAEVLSDEALSDEALSRKKLLEEPLLPEKSVQEKPAPGVSRENRICSEGLERLEKQLAKGIRISEQVLQQWIKRYGEQAAVIIEKYRRG